jgi:hypothetical protein
MPLLVAMKSESGAIHVACAPSSGAVTAARGAPSSIEAPGAATAACAMASLPSTPGSLSPPYAKLVVTSRATVAWWCGTHTHTSDIDHKNEAPGRAE